MTADAHGIPNRADRLPPMATAARWTMAMMIVYYGFITVIYGVGSMALGVRLWGDTAALVGIAAANVVLLTWGGGMALLSGLATALLGRRQPLSWWVAVLVCGAHIVVCNALIGMVLVFLFMPEVRRFYLEPELT